MSKEKFIKQLINDRKNGEEDPFGNMCWSHSCKKCILGPPNEISCSHEVISILLDHIINLKDKPKYKLTQFEFDTLSVYDELDQVGTLDTFYPLKRMKEKGYFKGVPTDINIFTILNSVEVINNE